VNPERSKQIAAGLSATRTRLADAARSVGRDPTDVHLIVVTKTWPVSDIAILTSLGARDLGENRHQEAQEKALATAELGVHWHFIGQVQSNKATKIAAYADTVHAVDSAKVVRRLDAGAQEHGRSVDCFIQVDLDSAADQAGRGGTSPSEVPELAQLVADAETLRLCGVMAVAPQHVDPEITFEKLARISEKLRRDHPRATGISAGMSSDFEAAVRCGATHVRIGALILGERPPLR
jgi:PLP dependent protein